MTIAEPTHWNHAPDDAPRPAVRLSLSRPFIVRVLYAFIVFFAVAHMAFSINRYVVHASFFASDNLYVVFDLWAEASIPSWFSISLLLVCSGLLAVIAHAKRAASDRYTRHWYGLALIFLALSIDDAADLHGHTSYKLQEMFEFGGFFAYAWVIPAAIACVAIGFTYLRFLVDLPRPIRWRFLLGAVLFISGALVLEMIEGRYDTQHGVENMPYRIMVAIEETLEMTGAVIFLSALLTHLSTVARTVEVYIHE